MCYSMVLVCNYDLSISFGQKPLFRRFLDDFWLVVTVGKFNLSVALKLDFYVSEVTHSLVRCCGQLIQSFQTFVVQVIYKFQVHMAPR